MQTIKASIRKKFDDFGWKFQTDISKLKKKKCIYENEISSILFKKHV